MTTKKPTSIPGFTVLLEGDSGTGKTFSTLTLEKAGIKPFYIFHDRSMATIAPLKEKHYAYIPPTPGGWDAIEQAATEVNSFSFDSLQKGEGIARADHRKFLDLVSTLNNFIDQDGEEFGDVADWGTNRALVWDGLTGVGELARQLTVGIKPVRAIRDWGIIQSLLMELLNQVVYNLNCHLILIAHLQTQTDEISGGIKKMVNTQGRAIAPIIPSLFDEVILTRRDGLDFTWETASPDTVTKSRLLPMATELKPDFGQVVEAWKKAGGVVKPAGK